MTRIHRTILNPFYSDFIACKIYANLIGLLSYARFLFMAKKLLFIVIATCGYLQSN